MRSSLRIGIIAAVLVVAAAWLVSRRSGSHNEDTVAVAASTATGQRFPALAGPSSAVTVTDVPPQKRSASRIALTPRPEAASEIYIDSKSTLADRFHALMNLARTGDADATYLAYEMQETCRIAAQLSKATVLPELWNQQMATALNTLKHRCKPLADDLEFQAFSAHVKDWTRAPFDAEVRTRIDQAFARSGATDAIAAALRIYRQRPEGATAMTAAETLSQLGVLKYDDRFRFNGTAAIDSRWQTGLFDAALMLHGCDFGVQCGPDSDLMTRLCATGAMCEQGQGLYQYFVYTISPQNMKSVDSILRVLRQIDADR